MPSVDRRRFLQLSASAAALSMLPAGMARGASIPTISANGSVPPTAGLMIAATRPEAKNFSTIAPAGVTGMNSQVPHRFPNGTGQRLVATVDAWGVGWDANIRKLWGKSSSYYDNAAGNPVNVAYSMSEIDGSAFYQGQVVQVRHSDGTITDYSATLPTSLVIGGSDSVDFLIDLGVASRAPGTWLVGHLYKSCAPGGSFFVHGSGGALSGARNEAVTFSSGEQDMTMQMMTKFPVASPAPGASWASSIRHVDAPPAMLRHPTVCLGDSLMAGSYGWYDYFANDTVPYVNLARGTETWASWLGVPSAALAALRRSQLFALGGFTRAVVQYGTNDLTAKGLTLGKLRAHRAATITQATNLGALLVGIATLPPNTRSTDSWSTLTNQSLDMRVSGRGKNEGVRQAYNADLRQGTAFGNGTPQSWSNPQGFIALDASGADEVIDTSANPTDLPQQIGKWYVDTSGNATTADGLHCGTGLGCAQWAADVDMADNFFEVGGS